MTVTPLYAALIALLFVGLSARVILYRRANQISLSDGNDKVMRRRIRAHGNCAEYAPIALLLLAFVEMQSASPLLLHSLGIMLLAGRLLHAIALSRSRNWPLGRTLGMVLTFTVILIAAGRLLMNTVLPG